MKLLHADSLRRRGVEKFKKISLTAVVTFNELLDAEPTAPALDIETFKRMRAEIAEEIEACENGKKLVGDPERYDSMIVAIKNVLRIVDRYEEEIHEEKD